MSSDYAYVVTPAFESFDTRHDAVGFAAVLRRQWPPLNVNVFTVDSQGLDAMMRIDSVISEVHP